MMVETSHIRWMIRSDYHQVIGIDLDAYDDPLDDLDLLQIMKDRATIGIVIEPDYGTIRGYCIYKLYSDRIEIVRLAVHPAFRRQGFGRQLVQRVINKVATGNRLAVVASVDECSLTLQLLFQSFGFVAKPNGDNIDFVYKRNT